MDPFEDIVSRLPELAKIQFAPQTPMILTIEYREEDDDFRIVSTNCDSQEEVVWLLTGMLTEFAIGAVDYCPELDGCPDDDED